GRTLGMPYADVDRVAKAIPQKPGVTLADALDNELKELYSSDDAVKNLIDISLALEGMPRHASTHAAGVVITDNPITDYVPLAVSSGTIVTQFDMDTIASLGLLKFDFLGLRYLTIISDAEKQIHETEPSFDIQLIPDNDTQTYDMMGHGQTEGVFQLESSGMKQLLTGFRPKTLEDIMVAIALYRPGPMDSIPRFLENRKNKNSIVYKIPRLRDILDETCGCIIYQEQVMRIFRVVANYSYGKADIIRRAMSRKNQGEMEKERETFILGAQKNNIGRSEASELFDEMLGFAKYAFNKSHAAAYAVISYRTAYLRCHYPCQYFAALLTSVLGNMPKMTEYIVECGKRNIKVLPPDINESNVKFTVSGNNIRFGMLALKNVGQNYVQAVIIERAKRRFSSFVDFIARMSSVETNKRAVESLIKSGAFDCFGIFRSRLLAVYEALIDSYTKRERVNIEGQLGLFDTESDEKGFVYPEISELSPRDKIMMEKESAGFCFSGHILDYYTNHMRSFDIIEINSILVSFDENNQIFKEKQIITIAGSVTKRVIKQTKNNETMAFITIEDRYAEIELVVFPRVYNEIAALLVYDNVLAVTGEITLREEESPKILVMKIVPLQNNDASQTVQNAHEPKKAPRLFLRFDHTSGIIYDRVVNLIEILEGDTPVMFYDRSKTKYIKFNGGGADVSGILLDELELILGKENVVLQ
ncbi:MAG: DNA polymerase III subunit alpha, partial [Eubacteriales bacterium]|nr:DNA polymerase III subunit alpha [Eubacteriales bacterium]